mmetsp:Transcript_67425/g.140885  ORF Transcript_67425/g.140885 Transcript_67425/m.140885 type:complete len:416 (-) Transcript_67425:288-1535(-)
MTIAGAVATSERRNGSGGEQTLTVLTVNLCIGVSGLTNRFLPRWFHISTMFWATVLAVLIPICLNLPWWVGLLLFPPLFIVLLLFLGLPLSRCLGPCQQAFGFDDLKKERIELFLQLLDDKPEWSSVDVICVQECFGSLFLSGGYPKMLADGARQRGFTHSVLPSNLPAFPATFAQNSGLMILSKIPIVDSASTAFGLSVESMNVNRGALYAKLEDGTHIFTCHVTPPTSVAGNGLLARTLGPIVEGTRASQMEELANFVTMHAPDDEPVVLAGDFNFDIDFDGFAAPAKPPLHSRVAVALLAERCGLQEATAAFRGSKDELMGGSNFSSDICLKHCRPTFGYTGEGQDQGPREVLLTSYGTGNTKNLCDDGAFSRGFKVLDVNEDSLLLPQALRRGSLTHLSDHWGVRLRLARR